jgi:FKBP-type peptidyl-prolyl cis-trans isomerase FkpA
VTPLSFRPALVAIALTGATAVTAPVLAQSAPAKPAVPSAPVPSAQAAAPAQPDPAEAFLKTNRAVKGVVETASGLQYQIQTPGTGEAKPTDADVTLIQYEGRLIDGTVFDKTQQPTPLPVTAVVPGFSEALKLMQKGGKTRFWIKPSLAYGDEATGPIPAHSILVFDIELLDFIPESVLRQMMLEEQQRQQAGAPPAPDAPAAPGAAKP